jgi:O-methyltransferase involved in polyketide biosynthesis
LKLYEDKKDPRFIKVIDVDTQKQYYFNSKKNFEETLKAKQIYNKAFRKFEKKEITNGNPSNIEFIECDITDLNVFKDELVNHNFKFDKPSIAVMEGIIYYLPTDSFKNILNFLKNNNIAFVGDFCLKPELVNEKTRFYLTDVFRKIKEEVVLDFINFYSTEETTNLLQEAGYKKISVSNMQQIQEERGGEKNPFLEKNSCWIMNIYAE